MCGIAGSTIELLGYCPEKTLQKMGDVLKHRGPDDSGIHINKYIGLVHRRLSIIDLSQNAKQPMISADGNTVIVFNGEIYNYLELRADLEKKGYTFQTKSDTEVLLYLYQDEQENCLYKLRGMFAFAIWDNKRKLLFLARDRIGKKPLFYYYDGKNIAFASEIKSILQIPTITKDIEYTALIDYLKYLYIPDPKTIYKSIFKLKPGHYLLFQNEKIQIKRYWDIGLSQFLKGSLDNILEELLALLKESIKYRLISDVPLGAFLSGGLDSSAIVALMSRLSNKPVITCSIGFSDNKHDETPFARKVAKFFNTDHHEYFVKENIIDIVKKLPLFFDEPFADSSAVPTYYVSKLARQAVTVALSGDGGDENFGGYEKYAIDYYENLVRRWFPKSFLAIIYSFSQNSKGIIFKKARSLVGNALVDPVTAYYQTNTFLSNHELEMLLSDGVKTKTNSYNPFDITANYFLKINSDHHLARLLYTDLKTYLPGDILVKVDRMSMANSLEVRAPFLDHKLIEFAARIPPNLKIKGRNKKYILKKLFKKILPPNIINRKKHGFTVPLNSWFRKEIRKVGEEYLLKKKYMEDFFNINELKKIWINHQTKRINAGTTLWSLLMFSLWYDTYLS